MPQLSLWQPVILRRFGLFLGGTVVLGGVAGAQWSATQVYETLAPTIARDLSRSLNRPVQLGAIEQISPLGIRLGRSTIPATATDPDTVTIEAVEVTVNPIDVMLKRKVELQVTLVRPQVFIEQSADGAWLDTKLEFEEDSPVEVGQIRFEDASVILVPKGDQPRVARPHLTISAINANIQLFEGGERLTYTLTGQPNPQGRLHVKGEADLLQHTGKMALTAQAIDMMPFKPLLPSDVRLNQGRLDSRLQVQWSAAQSPAVEGEVNLRDVAFRLKGEPNPFTQMRVQLQLHPQQIVVKDGFLHYGYIPFENLEGTINSKTGATLTASARSVNAPDFMKMFELKLPVPVKGALRTDRVLITGKPGHLVFSGTVYNSEPLWFDRLQIKTARTEFRLDKYGEHDRDHLVLRNTQFHAAQGGQVTANADLILGNEHEGQEDDIALNVAIDDFSADELLGLYGITPGQGPLGRIQAKATVSVLHENPTMVGQWHTVAGRYPAQGKLRLENGILRLQDTQIQVADGAVTVEGQADRQTWQAQVRGANIAVNQFFPNLPGVLQGEWQFSGRSDDLSVQGIQGQGQAIVQMADQAVKMTGDLHQGTWSAQVQGRDLPLNRFSATLPPGLQTAQLTGAVQLSGRLEDLDPQAIQAEAQGAIHWPEGTLTATGHMQQGHWTAQLHSDDLPLKSWSASLPGRLQGDLQLAGTLDNLRPEAIQAEGQVQLSDGIWAGLPEPVQAALQWNGQRLDVKQVTSKGLQANGWVDTRLQPQGLPAIADWHLNLTLNEYDLATLPMQLPIPLPLQGKVSFNGLLQGTPAQPQLNGHIQLNQLKVQQLAFEPHLAGDLNYVADQGLQVNLTGAEDRLALITKGDRALQFHIQRAQALVAGEWKQHRLMTTIQNLPLETLPLDALALPESLKTIGGTLSAQIEGNLANRANPSGRATFQIAQPTIGAWPADAQHSTDRLTGTLRYANHVAQLSNGLLQLGRSQLSVVGQVGLQANPSWSGRVAVAQGDLQDFLPLVQMLQPAGSSLPLPLSEVKGAFSADVQVEGTAQSGTRAQFGVQGNNWQWQQYMIKQVAANGQFDGQTLKLPTVKLAGLVDHSLQPKRRQYDSRRDRFVYDRPSGHREFNGLSLNFSGEVNASHSIGQMEIKNLPIALVLNWIGSGLPLSGQVDARADLSGSLTEPALMGTIKPLEVWLLGLIKMSNGEIPFSYSNETFQMGEDSRP